MGVHSLLCTRAAELIFYYGASQYLIEYIKLDLYFII